MLFYSAAPACYSCLLLSWRSARTCIVGHFRLPSISACSYWLNRLQECSRASWVPLCRVAVTSCCSTLWGRADVTNSEEIWGNVEAHWRGADAEADAAATLGRTRGRMAGLLARRQQQTQPQQPLVPWLARRRAGLRRVSLSLSGEVDLAEVERALSGAQLTHLSLKFGSSCRLPRLPPTLAALAPTLAELDCSGNNHVGLRQDTSLQALGTLGGLSRLALSNCGLRAVPHQLSVLRRLADLDLSQNSEMREGEDQLRHVAGTLTHLNISGSALQPARLAAQLGRFSALRALCLDADRHFGQETRDASPWLQLQDKLGGLKQLRLGGRLVCGRYLCVHVCGGSEYSMGLAALRDGLPAASSHMLPCTFAKRSLRGGCHPQVGAAAGPLPLHRQLQHICCSKPSCLCDCC